MPEALSQKSGCLKRPRGGVKSPVAFLSLRVPERVKACLYIGLKSAEMR